LYYFENTLGAAMYIQLGLNGPFIRIQFTGSQLSFLLYGLWVLRCFIGRFYGAIVTSILSGQCRKVRFHSIVHIFFNSFTYIFPHWFTLLEVMMKAYKKCR